jgi:hypothetical protein
MVFPDRFNEVVSGKRQNLILFSLQKVGMRHMESKLTIRKSLETPMVEKTEVSGVNDCVCSKKAGQFVDDSEFAVGITNQQKSHALARQSSFKVVLP